MDGCSFKAAALSLVFVCMAPSTARAEPVPDTFPPGVRGFWWGESIKSAAHKCEEFASKEKVVGGKSITQAECISNEVQYQLSFDSNGKLVGLGFPMSTQEYDACVEIVFRSQGIAGRLDDHGGLERWGLTYYEPKPKKVGLMMCEQRESGHRMLFLSFRTNSPVRANHK